MKILYQDLIELLSDNPSKQDLSKRLFQLGHEHEINGDIFEMELTPNRGDCFSLVGIARDLNRFYKYKNNIEIYNGPLDQLSIEFENLAQNDCPHISFLEIEIDGNISAYKNYMNRYFKEMNINSTNFFVDISNYLSYEIGQPTHCYDREKIQGKLILENKICEGEFKTLLNSNIDLKDKNLVFTNQDKIINLAGIMGNHSSACTSNTKKVLIECAFFRSEAILGKSSKYNITSDAAHKFERGVDPSIQEYALRRFIKIISDHTKILSMRYQSFNYTDFKRKELEIDENKINNILGTDIDRKEYIDILIDLGFEVDNRIVVPYFRSDISTQNDLAEEVARLIGYNNIKSIPVSFKGIKSVLEQNQKDIIRNFFKLKGFNEVINFPFTSNNSTESIFIDNPLDSSRSYLRTDLKSSLIDNLLYNERRQKDSVQLFEISDIYSKDTEIKKETNIGIIASGRQGENYKEFSKKIDSESLTKSLSDLSLIFEEIPRDKLNSKIKTKIFYAEIKVNHIEENFYKKYSHEPLEISFNEYKTISEFPQSVRDISFSISKTDEVDTVIETIENIDILNLKKSFMFDFFKNKNTDEIKIGYRFIFQSNLKTLHDDEINQIIKEIVEPLIKIDGIDIPGM